MKRVSVFLFLGFISTLVALAGSVKGTITDAKTKELLEFVNISITAKGSTALVKGTVTDNDGAFYIDGLKNGNYVLTVSYIGYKSETREFSITTEKPNVSLKSIAISEDSKMLQEVQVTGQKSQMKFEIDKKVFNVDQTIANTGGSASDVLENIPSVEVDNEGTVSLRGSESVTVWINGKASGLSSDNQGSILEQMPAESIEKIEVITNPSAKYSPEGTAGIINIVLKRDRKAGYYGSVQGGADTRGGYNGSANINYNSGVLDAYANVSYRMRKHESGNESNAQYFGADTTYQRQNSEGEMSGGNFFGRAGLTWHITQFDHLYTNFMGMYGGRDNDNTVKSQQGYLNGPLNYDRTRTTTSSDDSYMYNLELGFKHEFTTDHFIDLLVSHNRWTSNNDVNYFQQTDYLTGALNKTYQFQKSDINNKSTEIQLDYEFKMDENNRLEAGYKADFSRENSPVKSYSGELNSIVDESLWNRFIYNQDIHALYATYSGRIKDFGFQIGLRGEYWTVNTKSLDYTNMTQGTTVPYTKNDFFKLFPSVFLSYSLPHNHELQVNYTRRLRRPWGGQLNSFQNITDSTSISYGNPNLTPEYSNAYELNYIKNWEDHTLSVSSYYRTTSDEIERIRYNVGNIIYSTNENVAKSQSAGLEIVSKNKLFKIVDLTTTLNFFYYKLDAFSYTVKTGQIVTGEADEDFSWNARMLASIALPKMYTLQLTGRYNAKQIVAQGYREANYSLDAGIRKSFFNNKLSVAISGRDLLDSRKFHTVTSGAGFTQDSENWRGGREFRITLTYSFGNMLAKKNAKKKGEETGGSEFDTMDSYEGGDSMGE